MQARAYSFTAVAPDRVHVEAIAALRAELLRERGSLGGAIEVPNQVYLVVARRPA